LVGGAEVVVDEVLGVAEDLDRGGGVDRAGLECVAELFEVEEVVADGTGWDEEVDVEVVDDQAFRLWLLDFDQVDVPAAFVRAGEGVGLGELNAFVGEDEAAVGGWAAGGLVLREDRYVVREDVLRRTDTTGRCGGGR
jgi:hypothetical protein